MGCIGNLEKCNALCCRGFKLPKETQRDGNMFFVGHLDPDMIKFYELHENTGYKAGWLRIKEFKETEQDFEIWAKCRMLLPNLKCKIYYRNRPQICIDGYTKIKKGVWFPPNCIYTQG